MKSNTNSMAQRKAAESEIKTRFERLQDSLTERSRRLFAGSEALTFGYGGIAAFSRAIGLSQQTVRRGLWVSCQFWNLIAVDVLVVVGRN
jgi:flagellin-like hook-associated protein FlgL